MLDDPGDDYRNPRNADHYTALVHVYVDDVDAHFERAKAAGAEIVMEPTDQEYGTADTTQRTRRATSGPSRLL